MSRMLCMAALALAVVANAGCSSTGEVNVDEALQTRIDHREIAALSVERGQGVEASDAVSEAVQRLRGQLFGRLVAEGVFRQIVHAGDEARYLVEARLLAATEVSQGARILFGVFAGANQLAVKVRVTDIESGRQLTSFTAKGESASHPLSSENDMDDAIREVVDEIILTLRG